MWAGWQKLRRSGRCVCARAIWKRLKAVAVATVVVIVFFFPGRAFADSFEFKGQTVEFENADVKPLAPLCASPKGALWREHRGLAAKRAQSGRREKGGAHVCIDG